MFLKLLTVVLLAIDLINAGSTPCQTPDAKKGECKPLNECEAIKSQTSEYLIQSHCGFVGEEPKVCCSSSVSEDSGADFITNNLLPGKEVCGMASSSEVPWLAALESNITTRSRRFLCLGTLISKRYVLSSAHCTKAQITGVRLGEFSSESDCNEPKCVRVPVEEVVVFKSYEKFTHDIVLLKLKKEVTFSDHVKPICLPTTSDDLYKSYQGERLTLVSWRSVDGSNDKRSKIKIDIPVQELSKCKRNYGNLALHSGHLCAGGEEGKDACAGDGGGPLMAQKGRNGQDQWYLAGLTSFGPTPCGQKDKPSVYTRVSKYVAWVSDNLKSE